MDEFEQLTLSRTPSIEELHGFRLPDGLALTPPLVPATSPTSPTPALLASPSPAPLARPPALERAVPHAWTADELELAVGLFHRFGPRFRKIARHVAGRSEDAVRQLLKRRGLPVPRSSPVRRRSSKAPRWSRSEDRRLLQAFEAVPRHKRGNVPWCKVQAAAGLDRLPHSLRNRLARLAAMNA